MKLYNVHRNNNSHLRVHAERMEINKNIVTLYTGCGYNRELVGGFCVGEEGIQGVRFQSRLPNKSLNPNLLSRFLFAAIGLVMGLIIKVKMARSQSG